MKNSIPSRLLFILLLFAFSVTGVSAATKTFTGGAGFTFGNATKWNGGTLPVAGDDLIINGICIIDNNAATDNLAYGNLVIGGTSAGTLSWAASGTNRLNVVNMTSSFTGSSINMTNGGTLTLTGTWSNTNLAFTPGTGTIERQFSGLTITDASTYNNLTINSAGSVSTGIDITINGNLAVTRGKFFAGAFSLAVAGTTTVKGTMSITSATGTKSFGNLIINNGTFSNTTANENITISGNFQNNGIYSGGTGMVTFTGATSNTINGSSTTAFDGGITVNKGVSNANVLDVQGLITMVAGGLTLTNGTFKISGASTITAFTSDITVSPYRIPATAGLWVNGGIVSTSGDITVAGLVRVSDGTFNVGNAADECLLSAWATFIIEGGAFNIAGRFMRRVTGEGHYFTMTGGTLTVATVGSTNTSSGPFAIEEPTSSFTMSGGKIVIHRSGASTADFTNLAGTNNVTGGTLQFGDATTPGGETITVNSSVPVWNIVINGTNSPTAQLVTNSLNVKNNVTINSGGTLDATNLNIIVGNDWTSSGGFTEGTGTVTFTSTLIQTITKAAGETFYKLTVNTTGILKLANSITVTNTLAMTAGNINLNGNTLTLGSNAGATLTHAGATATAYGGTFRRWWPVGAISSSSAPLYGLFPIGAPYDYRVVEVNSTANPTTAGYVSASHTDAVTITEVNYTDNEGNDIERIQNMKSTLSTSGLAGGTYNLALKYTCLSATGLLPRMKLETYTGNVMGSVGTGGTTVGPVTAPTVKRTGVTASQLSRDFVVGTTDKVTTPLTQYYYSRKSGNASDNSATGTWSYTSGGAGAGCSCFPASDGYTVISAGHTITQDGPGAMSYVDISNGATWTGTFGATITNDITTIGTGKFTPTAGVWTVNRDLYVSATSNSSIPSGGMTVSMDLIVNGVLAVGANTLTLNGTGKTISGTGSITGAGTLSITTGNKTIAVGSTLTIAPTVAISGAIVVNNGGTVTLSGNLTGSVAGSTWTNDENSTLNVAGAVLATGTLNSSATNNVVNYNGGGAQTIKIPSSSMYYNLTCSNAGTKTLGAGTTRVNNLLTLSNAAILDVATNDLNGTGGLTMNNTSRLILSDITVGNQPQPSVNGTYTLASGTTIEFAGAGAQNATVAPYQNVAITGNNSASSVNMSNVTAILGNLTFTNMGQMNSNAALTISGNLSYGSSQTTTPVNPITVNGTNGSSFTAGTFDMNGENLTSYSLGMAGGTLLGRSGIINITTGNWTNNSTFTPDTGFVSFNGTSTQTISGSQTLNVFNLTTNNSSGITLNTNLNVSGAHIFSAGNITTSATPNYVIYAAGSSYSGDGDTRHVNGWVKKQGNTNFTFPVGNATYERAVAISNLSAISEINCKYSAPTGNTVNFFSPLVLVKANEYWQMDKISGGTARVTLNWDHSKVAMDNVLIGDILTAQYIAGNWDSTGGNASGNVATTGTITSDVLSSFGPFTLGYTSYPVPLKLISFTAIRTPGTSFLKWVTENEQQVDHFDVQRSYDGNTFTTIGRVAARNSDSREVYDHEDHSALNGIAYYRIRSVDMDARFSYSRIAVVSDYDLRSTSFVVLNPARNVITILNKTGENGAFDYFLYNAGGQLLLKGNTTMGINGGAALALPENISAGMYLLELRNGKIQFHQKLLVEK